VPPTGRGESDALNMRYPTLELEIPNDGDSHRIGGCTGYSEPCRLADPAATRPQHVDAVQYPVQAGPEVHLRVVLGGGVEGAALYRRGDGREPYFTGDPAQSRVPATFAMTTAVAQIWPGLRARHPALHRRTGRGYVCAAVPAAACALVIGTVTPFGPLVAASNAVGGSLWLWFTINGCLAARQRKFGVHRRHMIRSATLALSIITNRIWAPILFIALEPLQDSIFHGDETRFGWMVAGLTAWLGWTIPLLIVQWWMRRRKSVMAPSSISPLVDTARV
jgi:uncharacterized membrane protein